MSELVDQIRKDICGRSGGDHWFEGCDEDIQQEILDTWTDLVRAHDRQVRREMGEALLKEAEYFDFEKDPVNEAVPVEVIRALMESDKAQDTSAWPWRHSESEADDK